MALGCPLLPHSPPRPPTMPHAVLMVYLMSDLGVGEGIPADELSHPTVGRRRLSSPHPTPDHFRKKDFPGTLSFAEET